MEEISLMIPKSGAKFEEKLIFCFKNDKNLENFDPSTKIGPFCAKYTTFDLKSEEELYFMTLNGHAKFEEKLICGLENDRRKFHQNT